jgi:hypothetical protein
LVKTPPHEGNPGFWQTKRTQNAAKNTQNAAKTDPNKKTDTQTGGSKQTQNKNTQTTSSSPLHHHKHKQTNERVVGKKPSTKKAHEIGCDTQTHTKRGGGEGVAGTVCALCLHGPCYHHPSVPKQTNKHKTNKQSKIMGERHERHHFGMISCGAPESVEAATAKPVAVEQTGKAHGAP